MDYIYIENELLQVAVKLRGGVLHSIRRGELEYLWQGDSAFWDKRDVNIFPFVGRLHQKTYTYAGQAYTIGIHGFADQMDFSVVEHSRKKLVLQITDTEQTKVVYPFSFCYRIEYALSGNTLRKTAWVHNRGKKNMYFGIGSHPGFQVPLGGDGEFSDWYLEFSERSEPVRIGFDQSNLLRSRKDVPWPIEEGKIIRLSHSLFDEDAVVLQDTASSVTLRSSCSTHQIRVSWHGTKYLGIWHRPGTRAPYVCIEPWSSLPAFSGEIAALEKQHDLICLNEGAKYRCMMEMIFT